MHSAKKYATLLLFLILLGSALAQAPRKNNNPNLITKIAHYFSDRAVDFLDIFRVRLSMAKRADGLGLHARATALAQIGAVYFNGEHFGMDRRALGLWREKRWEGGISLFYFSDIRNEVIYGNRFTDVNDPWTTYTLRGIVRNHIGWDDGRYHPLSLGVEAQWGILPGIDIGLYPLEAVDFIVGFFTLDPFDDDLSTIDRAQRLARSTGSFQPELVAPEQASLEIELEPDLGQMIKSLEEEAKEIKPEKEAEEPAKPEKPEETQVKP